MTPKETPMTTNPDWRQVPGHPRYEIAPDGSVRSFVWTPLGRALKWKMNTGYPRVCLDGKYLLVHRLVALTFIGPPPVGRPEVAHNDGDPNNPNASNLRWASHVDNHADRARHGTANRGDKSPMRKVSEADVVDIRTRYANGEKQAVLASEYGVRQPAISRIVTKVRWSHV